MFNVGGGEVLVILLVTLLVLGPSKLPDAARQVGAAMTQLRRLSSGFQNELRAAMDEAPTPDTSAPDAPPAGRAIEEGGDGTDAPDQGGDGDAVDA